MPESFQRPTNLRELRASGWKSKTVKQEIHDNFLRKLKTGEELYPGIIGFDDTRLCTLVSPTLSSVRVPLQDIGAAAISALIRRVEHPDAEPQRIRIKPTLVNRESGG